MAHYTLKLRNAVPIPVNHRIKIDVFEQNDGTFKESWSPKPEWATVTDLDTGVVWRCGTCFDYELQLLKTWRFYRSYWGVVTSCEVMTESSSDSKRTLLVVFPTEGPGEGSPFRGR